MVGWSEVSRGVAEYAEEEQAGENRKEDWGERKISAAKNRIGRKKGSAKGWRSAQGSEVVSAHRPAANQVKYMYNRWGQG
jgi:hypothetical protein